MICVIVDQSIVGSQVEDPKFYVDVFPRGFVWTMGRDVMRGFSITMAPSASSFREYEAGTLGVVRTMTGRDGSAVRGSCWSANTRSRADAK